MKGIYESFAEDDIEAVVATWASDIEFNEPEGFIGGGTFHGSDEIVENLFGVMANDWEEVSVVPEKFVDGDDTIVALITWSGTSTETGKSVESPGGHTSSSLVMERLLGGGRTATLPCSTRRSVSENVVTGSGG